MTALRKKHTAPNGQRIAIQRPR